MGHSMRISLIPDECSSDPATAFELGRRWGIEDYEIRQASRWRVPVGPGWAADRVAAAVADYGVNVTAISPGLFKPTMRTDGTTVPVSTETPDQVRRHLDELLPAFLDFAGRLGTRRITVFALPKPAGAAGPAPRAVIDALAEAAEKASAAGFELLLENGAGSWADTAEATTEVLEAVASPALGLTWDPANAAWADPKVDPVERGYPRLARHVRNVHVKDVAFGAAGPGWAQLGDGQIDWPGQLRRLVDDGYAGPLTLEPHLQYNPETKLNLVARVERFAAHLREMLGALRIDGAKENPGETT